MTMIRKVLMTELKDLIFEEILFDLIKFGRFDGNIRGEIMAKGDREILISFEKRVRVCVPQEDIEQYDQERRKKKNKYISLCT